MSVKTPMPGYLIAAIDSSQMSNVDFTGDDRFDLPQSGEVIELSEDDKDTKFNKKGETYGSLLGKKVYWSKYAEADALFFDSDLNRQIVIISLEKLRGIEG